MAAQQKQKSKAAESISAAASSLRRNAPQIGHMIDVAQPVLAGLPHGICLCSTECMAATAVAAGTSLLMACKRVAKRGARDAQAGSARDADKEALRR